MTTSWIPTDAVWQGIGVNVLVDASVASLPSQLQRFGLAWARISLNVPDPGTSAIANDDAGMDQIWETSEGIATNQTLFAYSAFQGMNSTFVFTMASAPASWLTTDGLNELRGDALVAFSRLWASAVHVHREHGIPVYWIELLDNVTAPTFISPDNYVVLVQSFKSILTTRFASLNPPKALDAKVMGPAQSLLAQADTTAPYVAAFLGQSLLDGQSVLDAWSIHLVESQQDVASFNAGTLAARNYVRTQLGNTVQFMRYASPSIPIYVTKIASNATRFSLGIDYGWSAPETVEYAMRIMDSVCGIVANQAMNAISWYLDDVLDVSDNQTLYRVNGSRRPIRDAWLVFESTFPTGGAIFSSGDDTTNPSDQTIKAFVMGGNSFGFVLSRVQASDATQGRITMNVTNSSLTGSPSTWTATLQLLAFPNYTSLVNISKQVTVGNGQMTIALGNLPYSCVIYGKGDVYQNV